MSDESVERLLKSRAHRVIGALLGNSSLSKDVLRRAELRAHGIGMSARAIVWDGKGNASMPVDVVESWLTCSDERARLDALESPAAPRNILWEHLTKDVNFAEESPAGYNIFAYESNADGDMIDWFLTRWEKQARDELHRGTRRRWVAEAALSHPRARATTLERLYARYGAVSWWLRSTVAKAPSCPDWVRHDAARKLAVEDGALMMRTGYPCASPESVRALYECWYLTVVAGCENDPGDLLAEVLEGKLRAAVEAQGDGSNSAPRFKANDVIVPLSHDNMPVGVVLEWAGDATLRQYVLGSPVLPREELVQLLLEGVDDNLEVAARYAFERWSNADGQIIDWYVNMWFRSAESSSRFHDNVGVERALSHPRTWGSTLERVYARYGGNGKYGRGMVKSILRSPSCPDWVRWDVLSRGDKNLIQDAARESESVPHGFARALADNGYWEEAVDCPNAPGDVLADAVEHIVNLYKWQGESSLAGHQFGRFLASENMPPEVRRACARWSHVSLWAVARDGFLGRI